MCPLEGMRKVELAHREAEQVDAERDACAADAIVDLERVRLIAADQRVGGDEVEALLGDIVGDDGDLGGGVFLRQHRVDRGLAVELDDGVDARVGSRKTPGTCV